MYRRTGRYMEGPMDGCMDGQPDRGTFKGGAQQTINEIELACYTNSTNLDYIFFNQNHSILRNLI